MKRSRTLLFTLCLSLVLICLFPPPPPSHAWNEPRVDQPLLRFAVFSDTHVMSNWNPEHLFSVEKFRRALSDIRPFRPQFMVLNGDLTNGTPADYHLFKKLYVQGADYPLYPTMGNHDYYYQWTHNDWNDQRAQDQFKAMFHLDRLYYDRYEQGVHLIWLAPEQYMPMQKQIGEAAWLSDQQIAWFRQKLRESDAPTFVFLHQPLSNTLFSFDGQNSTVQTEQLLQIARQHPQVIWVSGHSHAALDNPEEIHKRGNILFVSAGSIFKPEERFREFVLGAEKANGWYLQPNPAKSQSRYIEVYSDRIVIRARDHHLRRWNPYVYIEPLRRPLKPANA